MNAGLSPSDKLAQRLALGIPAIALGFAYTSQYGFGLYPCEMCWWQRWPHFAAIALALVSTVVATKRPWIAPAALAIAVSGAIGVFHAGVEYGWWEGVTACTNMPEAGGDPLEAIFNAPIVRCDIAPFHFLGLSMAGWNAVVSLGSAAAIAALLLRKDRT